MITTIGTRCLDKYVNYLCSVKKIRNIKIGYIISSDDVWIHHAYKLLPFQQHVCLRGAADHLGANYGQTGVQREHVADHWLVASLQSDGVGDLDNGVMLSLGKVSFSPHALDVKAEHAQGGNNAPGTAARVGDDVVESDVRFDAASTHVFDQRTDSVFPGGEFYPVGATYLLVDHEPDENNEP